MSLLGQPRGELLPARRRIRARGLTARAHRRRLLRVAPEPGSVAGQPAERNGAPALAAVASFDREDEQPPADDAEEPPAAGGIEQPAAEDTGQPAAEEPEV